MIAALLNQKGGVGKTTLSIHLARALSAKGRTLLLDADPQGSSVTWSAQRTTAPPFSVMALSKPTIHRDIAQLAAGYSHVVIDGPPRSSDLASSVVMASDFILIPVQPSPLDIWAAQSTVDLIRDAQIVRPHLRAAFVLNRKTVNTAISKDAREVIAELGLPVLSVELVQRVIFAESAATGSTVDEVEPNGSAAREIAAFASEVESLAA